MTIKIKSFYLIVILLLNFLWCGCASEPFEKEVSYQEDLSQLVRDESDFNPFVNEIKSNLKIVENLHLENYLNALVQKIKSQTDYFQNSNVTVYVHRSPIDINKNFSIPGIYIFISMELLKKFQYESELASFFALQFSILENRYSTLEKFQLKKPPVKILEYLSETAIDDHYLNLLPLAVKILYQSKYDPRSFMGLWKHFMNMKKIDQKGLSQLELKTFKENSFYTPIKDPIIQTEGFNGFQKILGQF